MRLRRNIPAIAMTAIALIGLTAPSASAGKDIWLRNSTEGNQSCTPPDSYRGTVLFEDQGDIWRVTDGSAGDGYSVRVRVWVDGEYTGMFRRPDIGYAAEFDRAYPNGALVLAQIFLHHDASGYNCGFNTEAGLA